MSDGRHQTPLDVAVARLAARQHGVISLSQLVTLGLTASAVRDRVAAGRLHRVHRGVYSVGHRLLSTEGFWMAAVLACGEGALLSHRSGAQLWGIQRRGRVATTHVTASIRMGRKHRHAVVHSGASLTAADSARRNGIAVTSVPRTLLDLADRGDQNEVDRAVEKAEAQRLFDLVAVRELLARSNGRRGATRLTRAIGQWVETITRTDMEDAFLAICANAGLARPRVNVWLGDIEVDFMWPAERLIVETDGGETHATRDGIERDHRRDRRLRAEGWRVERFTWREIVHEPEAVAAVLTELLSAAA